MSGARAAPFQAPNRGDLGGDGVPSALPANQSPKARQKSGDRKVPTPSGVRSGVLPGAEERRLSRRRAGGTWGGRSPPSALPANQSPKARQKSGDRKVPTPSGVRSGVLPGADWDGRPSGRPSERPSERPSGHAGVVSFRAPVRTRQCGHPERAPRSEPPVTQRKTAKLPPRAENPGRHDPIAPVTFKAGGMSRVGV